MANNGKPVHGYWAEDWLQYGLMSSSSVSFLPDPSWVWDSQARCLCIVFSKYDDDDNRLTVCELTGLCGNYVVPCSSSSPSLSSFRVPEGLHTVLPSFQVLVTHHGRPSSQLNQAIQALKFKLALHPLSPNTARTSCLT